MITSADAVHFLLLPLLLLVLPESLGFSADRSSSSTTSASPNLEKLRSAILNLKEEEDATSFHHLLFTSNSILSPSLFYASDFITRQEIDTSDYHKFCCRRHDDCLKLFGGYNTEILRCEAINESSLNVRWKSSWIPAGSTWLYDLAKSARWDITTKNADPALISTFSWISVFRLFSTAFATGNITLPISLVEGNTVVSLDKQCASIKESIDLVLEADASRLQNRRVAQELAAWLDVSRRPDECGIGADEWAGIVRSRILSGVPGAGSLDVDPNEEDKEGLLAILLFGSFSLTALALSYEYFIMPEVVGGTGQISTACEESEILEFGSGYLSECFGPYGDGPFVR